MFILVEKSEIELYKVYKMSGGVLRKHALAKCDNCGDVNYVRLDHAKKKVNNNPKNGRHYLAYTCKQCAFGVRENLEVVK